MHKMWFMFLILGRCKDEHLHMNIEALSITLTPMQMHHIESVKLFDPGFPNELIIHHFYFFFLFHMVVLFLPCHHTVPPLLWASADTELHLHRETEQSTTR